MVTPQKVQTIRRYTILEPSTPTPNYLAWLPSVGERITVINDRLPAVFSIVKELQPSCRTPNNYRGFKAFDERGNVPTTASFTNHIIFEPSQPLRYIAELGDFTLSRLGIMNAINLGFLLERFWHDLSFSLSRTKIENENVASFVISLISNLQLELETSPIVDKADRIVLAHLFCILSTYSTLSTDDPDLKTRLTINILTGLPDATARGLLSEPYAIDQQLKQLEDYLREVNYRPNSETDFPSYLALAALASYSWVIIAAENDKGQITEPAIESKEPGGVSPEGIYQKRFRMRLFRSLIRLTKKRLLKKNDEGEICLRDDLPTVNEINSAMNFINNLLILGIPEGNLQKFATYWAEAYKITSHPTLTSQLKSLDKEVYQLVGINNFWDKVALGLTKSEI